ncbi:hypothetical protein O181_020225 [Austropuccinia psidii MF-1]|uniref:Uncharacterized protein n=1 Tax=Austropuccinia psidii MF-1 TaxID=1389203 RepID=A0A9Q3CDC5_9BASI|nr:hypothetical protein [Austropuccinia psidii MF-1]
MYQPNSCRYRWLGSLKSLLIAAITCQTDELNNPPSKWVLDFETLIWKDGNGSYGIYGQIGVQKVFGQFFLGARWLPPSAPFGLIGLGQKGPNWPADHGP